MGNFHGDNTGFRIEVPWNKLNPTPFDAVFEQCLDRLGQWLVFAGLQLVDFGPDQWLGCDVRCEVRMGIEWYDVVLVVFNVAVAQ